MALPEDDSDCSSKVRCLECPFALRSRFIFHMASWRGLPLAHVQGQACRATLARLLAKLY